LLALVIACAGALAPRTVSAASEGALADTAWLRCGVPLSIGNAERIAVVTVPDGAGGAFVLWERLQPVTFATDLYGQHVDANGAIVPGWASDGLGLCTAPGDQSDLAAAPDGAGGVLAAWTDQRLAPAGGAHPAIFALRVAGDGSPVAGWTAGGTAVAPLSRPEQRPVIAGDGASGAFIAWEQPVAGSPDDGEIALQHLLADGGVAPGWPDSGLVVATGSGPRADLTLVSDGAGGCVLAWDDGRGADEDIYAQRVDGGGAALWTANGVLACGAADDQVTPRGVSDGAGGIVIAIEDLSAGNFTSVDLIAQRLDATGARPAGWPIGGVALTRAADAQVDHRIASDGAGGALVSWDDYRSGQPRVYLQHVRTDGTIADGFAADGNGVPGSPGEEFENDLASDGAGGALVAWTQAGIAIRVQRVHGDGSLAAGWDSTGVVLCPADSEFTPVLVGDGAQGAVVAFLTSRGDPVPDLFASHVTRDAVVPALMALASVEATPASVTLTWYGAGARGPFAAWRGPAGEAWQPLGAPLADGAGLVRLTDRDVRPGESLTYRLTPPDRFDAPLVPDVSVVVPASAASRPPRLTPNPAGGALVVELSLARAADVTWALIDVTGRRVAGAALGRLGAGVQRRALAGTAALPAGVYTLRVTRDGAVESARACVVR
jgi:hypothetical protein